MRGFQFVLPLIAALCVVSWSQPLRAFERREEPEKEAATDKAKASAQVTAGKDGFSFQSADGAFQIRFRGYAQFDGRSFGEDRERNATDTFLIRRARPLLEGTVGRIFDFRIMPDFGGGTTVLQDAYMEARFSPKASVRAGKFKPPVGLERLQSATDLLFVERALPTNLVPNRDLGVQLSGVFLDGALGYAVGVFNGVPDGASADADTNDTKEEAGRVFLLPFKNTDIAALKGLGIGASATFGDNDGTLSAPGLPAYKTAGQQTFFAFRANGTAAGTALADGRHERFSPQAYWYAGRFGSMAEIVRSSQKVRLGADTEELVSRAWQLSTSFLLTRDATAYRSVNPKKPLDASPRGWGALELAARAGKLTIADEAFPLFANPGSSARQAKEIAAGINWYLSRNVRVMFDAVRTRFKGGGLTADREDEKVLLSRFQIAF